MSTDESDRCYLLFARRWPWRPWGPRLAIVCDVPEHVSRWGLSGNPHDSSHGGSEGGGWQLHPTLPIVHLQSLVDHSSQRLLRPRHLRLWSVNMRHWLRHWCCHDDRRLRHRRQRLLRENTQILYTTKRQCVQLCKWCCWQGTCCKLILHLRLHRIWNRSRNCNN